MEWFEAIILGLVQGLTEFLPVSSSGHLVIGREILGVEESGDLVFEVAVHAATVLSTIVVFRHQIWSLLKGLFRFRYNDETDYILKICVSMIPVFIIGVFFKSFVEGLFASLFVVGVALLMTALLLFLSDRASNPRREKLPANNYRNGISYWQALAVGIGQAFAVIRHQSDIRKRRGAVEKQYIGRLYVAVDNVSFIKFSDSAYDGNENRGDIFAGKPLFPVDLPAYHVFKRLWTPRFVEGRNFRLHTVG